MSTSPEDPTPTNPPGTAAVLRGILRPSEGEPAERVEAQSPTDGEGSSSAVEDVPPSRVKPLLRALFRYMLKHMETPKYGSFEYWDKHYEQKQAEAESEGHASRYDWYLSWEQLKGVPSFEESLRWREVEAGSVKPRVLLLGVGNSPQGELMAEAGYEVVGVDISSTVIAQMEQEGKNGVDYRVMDVRALDFSDESFDIVIDKGTMDTLLCTDERVTNTRRMVHEAHRVLAPGGSFLVVTYGNEAVRRPHIVQRGVTHWANGWYVGRRSC